MGAEISVRKLKATLSRKTPIIFATTILLLGSLLGILVANPSTHGQFTGTVCIVSPGTTSCPSSPTGSSGTQLRVSVFVQNSDLLNVFDITLLADHTVLKPAGADLTGTILPGPQTILVECLSGILVKGNVCPLTDTIDTLHFAVAGQGFTAQPATGLLFTAIYNVTATSSGTTLGFQTGCGSPTAPTSHPPFCVTIANGIPTPVPENVQTAVFSTGAGPDFMMTDQTSLINIQQGNNLATDQITLDSINGFAGTVGLTSSVSPSGGPTSTMNPTAVSLSPGGSAFSTLTVSVTSSTPTGAYVVTVLATSGTTSHSIQVTVNVNPAPKPDFTLTVTPSSQSVTRGSSATFTVSIMGTNGFNGTVSLSATVAPLSRHGPTTSLPSTVGPNSSSTLTVSTVHNTPTGSYTITVTGTSGSLSHTVTVTVTVIR